MDIEQSHLSGNPISQITGSAAIDESRKQSKQLSQGEESPEWISGEEWSILIDPESDVDLFQSPSVVSVFRVPSFLKKSVEEAYVPQIVSLGPYHHRNAQLHAMINHKGKAFHLLGLFHSLIVSAPFSDDQNKHDADMLSQAQAEGHPHSLSQPLIAASPPCHHVDQSGAEDESKEKRISRADILRNAAIKFKACNGGIEKIRFEPESGTIFLPPIGITDHTEVLFRNLIALEVCKPSEINYVSCYVSLMDELIDSEEDVGVLTESEVVINYLGSNEEVAKLFNVLLDGVTLSRTDPFQQMKQQVDPFQQMKQELDKHYKSKLKVMWADFIENYISSPWKTLALLGTVAGLLLTLLQTIYSIIAFYI